MEKIFAYENYTQYLKDLVAAKKAQGVVGLGQKLASAICCHPSLVSQILKGHAHFSVEQAIGAAEFLGLSDLEKDYFINLVLHERACTADSKKHFRQRLDSIIQNHLRLSYRWTATSDMTEEFKATYFTSWQMQAIHALTQIESLQDEQTISKSLNIPLSAVVETLSDLERMGVIERKDGRWHSTRNHLLLDKSSIWIKPFHRAWRLKSQNRLYGQSQPKDFHFSGVLTFAEKDHDRLLEILMEALEKIRKELPQSTSETANVLAIDFFKLMDPA